MPERMRFRKPKPTSQAFLRGYLETALWSSRDEDGRPLDESFGVDDFAPQAIEQATIETNDFLQSNLDDLIATGAHDTRSGHDFWLTRNRHGAGFWDRGYGEVGKRLTDAAHVYGEVDIYVGDNGMLYFQ